MTINLDSGEKDVGLIVRNSLREDSYFINYAYIGSYNTNTTGSITALSKTLSVEDGSRLEVGDRIGIEGAGTNGVRLITTITAKDFTTITVDDAAVTTISSKGIVKFDDDSISTTDVVDYIFFDRPIEQGQDGGLKAQEPRINVTVIGNGPEEKRTLNGKIEVAYLCIAQFYLDKGKAQSLDGYDFSDNIKRIVRNLRKTDSDIKETTIIGSGHSNIPENNRIDIQGEVRFTLIHIEG